MLRYGSDIFNMLPLTEVNCS